MRLPLAPAANSTEAMDAAMPTQMVDTRKKMNNILAACTGQPLETIERDTERDHYMTAQEAVEYGLVDKVITAR